MKKIIPYIFIAAFIGSFMAFPFAGQLSGIISGPQKAEAQTTQGPKITAEQEKLGPIETKGAGIFSFLKSTAFGVLTIGSFFGWGEEKMADATIGRVLAWISDFTWWVSARIFNMSGYLMDYAVDFSVKDFKQNIKNIGVIDQGYKIILNVANMLFIFILLYIAIKTILGMGGDTKKLLTNIIVVALLINFSLFMTKVLIDASNIISMGFYKAIRTEAGKITVDKEEQKIIAVGSVSTAMMAGLRLQTQMPAAESPHNKGDPSRGLNNFNIAINQFGGSALFLVSAFVFFSVAFLFIIRFIALLFYMLFSPIAFLGMISPELKEHSSKWWGGLQSQLIFAPAFLFIAYLISALVNSGNLWGVVGGKDNISATFYDFISSSDAAAFPIVMNYVILIALMIGGLIVAKTMAAKGSAGMVGYSDKVRGWVQGAAGRNTIGRAAYLAGNNRYMAKLMTKSPTVGNFVKSQFDDVAGQKFGSKIGYAEALKKSVDKKKKMGEFVGKAKVGKTDEMIRKEEELIDEKMKSLTELKNNVNDARMEHRRLADIASRTMLAADLDAAQLAHEALQREEAILEDQNYEISRANENIKTIASFRKKAQEKMKKEYAKNIEFASWGLGPLDKIFRSGADAAAEIRKPKGPLDKSLMDIIKEYNAQQASAGGGAGGTTGGAGGAGGAGTGGATGGGATP